MQADFKKILSSDSSRMIAEIAVNAIGNNPEYFDFVLEMSLSEKSPVNWRASRAVELSTEKYPEFFLPHVNKIAELFPVFTTAGLKRSYAKILANYINEISEDNLSVLIDVSFKYLNSDKQDIAVRAYCMLFLYKVCEKIPELANELRDSILLCFPYFSVGLKGAAKKTLKKLDKLKR